MMGRIEVIHELDVLSRERWVFWFDDRDASLVLDEYQQMERPSPRHKFRVVKFYARLDVVRHSYRGLNVADVPLPADVEREAVAKFCAPIHARKELERAAK